MFTLVLPTNQCLKDKEGKKLTIMYYYNFKTKEVSHMLDGVTHVVLGSNMDITLNCTKEQCSIVELAFASGPKLFVGYPAEALGKCFIDAIYTPTQGKLIVDCTYGKRKVSFTIHGELMYLSNGM